jgi:hypothetical protein
VTAAQPTWPGCYGVRVDAGSLDVGRCRGVPLLHASVSFEPIAAPERDPVLWPIDDTVDTADGPVAVDQRLHGQPAGPYVVTSNGEPLMRVDPAERHIAANCRSDAAALQLLATFGLPLLLHQTPVLLLHASAACLDGGKAVVICARSGVGKSSALVGLINAGWRAVTEDVCAIDLGGPEPMVWPGPPWVRRHHGLPGPDGAASRFDAPDKTAWDTEPWRVSEPVPVGEIVIMDKAGGERSVEELSPPDAVRLLARHAQWFGDPDGRGRALFDRVADIALRVPARQARLARRDDWVDDLLEIVRPAAGTARSSR